MKILIVRPWPSVLDVTKNTYNIQEVGLAKALVKRGHPTDILFWTDGDEMTVKVEVEGAKPINVFYRHGKVLLKNVCPASGRSRRSSASMPTPTVVTCSGERRFSSRNFRASSLLVRNRVPRRR